MILSSKLGAQLGNLIGGPAGAIIGPMIGLGIESGLQYYKEDVVEWLDSTFDNFLNWLLNAYRGIVNA